MNKTKSLIVAFAMITSHWAIESSGADDTKAKANAILERMSQKLQSASAFTFATDETWEMTEPSSEKVKFNVERKIAVRRPDRMWFRATGDRDLEMVYDGKEVTLVSHKEKVFGRFPAASTLDATADVISWRYDIPVPIMDLVTEAPAAALSDASVSGKWEKRENVNGIECDKLTYDHRNVGFSIWIPVSGDPLPAKLMVKQKTRRRLPTTTVMFKDWNLSPRLPDDLFTARIPAGYEAIPVIQRASAVLSDTQLKKGPDAAGAAPKQK